MKCNKKWLHRYDISFNKYSSALLVTFVGGQVYDDFSFLVAGQYKTSPDRLGGSNILLHGVLCATPEMQTTEPRTTLTHEEEFQPQAPTQRAAV